MGKRLVLFFCFIFLFSLASAVPPFQSTTIADSGLEIESTNFLFIKQGDYHTFRFRVYNATTNSYKNDTEVNCSFGIIDEKGSYVFQQPIVPSTGYVFIVNITGGNFSELGIYHNGINCITNDGESGGVLTRSFEVTYSGYDISQGQSTLYIGFLGLLVFLFFLNFIGMGYLPSRNTTNEEGNIMSINYLKYFRNVLWMTGYFLFIAIFYIASSLAFSFLREQLVAKTLFMIFQISFGISPIVVIVWLVWIFASMFQDKEFQRILNRGMFPQQV